VGGRCGAISAVWNAIAYTNGDGDSYGYCNCYANSHSYSNSDIDTSGYSNSDTYCEAHSHTEASAYAAAPPVEPNSRVIGEK
jgi:hypothetical protein